MSQQENMRVNGYRPDIDGLRAIAVMGVLWYHISERWVSGGYVGVDVFFVISGYLISGIIAREIEAGRFSVLKFYERRVRRIFPALLVMLLVVILGSWYVLLPSDWEAFGKSVRYALVGVSNLLFFKNTQDYFQDGGAAVPLMHTWSLGVEEQFYLVFPVGLWVLYRYVRAVWLRMAVLVGLAVVSLVASALVIGRAPMAVFFLLPYRAWELLLGCVISLAVLPSLGRGWNQALGGLGLVMIGGAMVGYDNGVEFPGLAALLPCVGAGLLLWTGKDEGAWTTRLLSNRWMVGVGLISYSLYLWHWPLIVWSKYFGEIGVGAGCWIFLASMGLAYASWRWVEQPVRRMGGSKKRLWLGWLTGSVAVLVAVAVMGKVDPEQKRYSAEVKQVLAYREKPKYWTAKTQEDLRQAPEYGVVGAKFSWVLWGDSHGTALLPMVDELAKEHGKSLKKMGYHGSPPVAGLALVTAKDAGKQLAYSERVLAYAQEHTEVELVVMHGRWSLYNMGKNEKGKSGPTAFFGVGKMSRDAQEAYYFKKFEETVRALAAAGKRVVVVGPVPEVGVYVPDYLAKQALSGKVMCEEMPCEGFMERNHSVLAFLGGLEKIERVAVIYPHRIFWNEGRVRVRDGGEVFYCDDDHLSKAGAMRLKGELSRCCD